MVAGQHRVELLISMDKILLSTELLIEGQHWD